MPTPGCGACRRPRPCSSHFCRARSWECGPVQERVQRWVSFSLSSQGGSRAGPVSPPSRWSVRLRILSGMWHVTSLWGSWEGGCSSAPGHPVVVLREQLILSTSRGSDGHPASHLAVRDRSGPDPPWTHSGLHFIELCLG